MAKVAPHNPSSADGKSLTPKQIRARRRRAAESNKALTAKNFTREELDALVGKPVSEWDIEELAMGRPRNSSGTWKGPAPKWITREMHEEALTRFKDMVRTDMRSLTVKSLEVLGDILENEEEDEKGRPIVSATDKKDVAKFLIEHLIGKPTQPIEADISIKLQHVLGAALVMPADAQNYVPSSSHRRVIEGSVVTEEEDEEDEDGE